MRTSTSPTTTTSHTEHEAPESRGADSGVFRREGPLPPSVVQLAQSVARFSALSERSDRNRQVAELSLRAMERIRDEELLLGTVGDVAPHLCGRIARLRDNQLAVRLTVSTLYRLARSDAPQAMLHVTIEQLNTALSHHRDEVDNLVQEALLTDIGGEG